MKEQWCIDPFFSKTASWTTSSAPQRNSIWTCHVDAIESVTTEIAQKNISSGGRQPFLAAPHSLWLLFLQSLIDHKENHLWVLDFKASIPFWISITFHKFATHTRRRLILILATIMVWLLVSIFTQASSGNTLEIFPISPRNAQHRMTLVLRRQSQGLNWIYYDLTQWPW